MSFGSLLLLANLPQNVSFLQSRVTMNHHHLQSIRPKSITIPECNIHSNSQTKLSMTHEFQIQDMNYSKNSFDHHFQNNTSITTMTPSLIHPPTHIAIITDGNSRWSKQQIQQPIISRFLTNNNNINPTFLGHSKGGNRVISLLLHLKKHYTSVKYVTIYGFSSENWSRQANEINDLWKVMERTLSRFHDLAIREKIVVKMIGELDDERIPPSLRKAFRQLEMDTMDHIQRLNKNDQVEYQPLTLCLAINYGGRNDIVQASRRIAEMVSRNEMQVNDITSDVINDMLSTSGIPEPDLLIRTGGEQRLSNFLLWNCAYSELYFTNVLWPDFDDHQLDVALKWYESRERRFGGRRD